jgi:hypothetical protein
MALSDTDKVEAIAAAHVMADALKTWPKEKLRVMATTLYDIAKERDTTGGA